MSIAGLMNQLGVLYPVASYSGDGRPVFSAGSNVYGRFQIPKKRNYYPKNLDGKSSITEIDAIFYVPANTTVETDYKFTYSSIDYKIVGKYAVPDANGNTHHIRLELKKWQST